MSSSDDTLAAARAALHRSRTGEPERGVGGALKRGAVLGAVASLPVAGIGLIGGAVIGAGAAALDALTKD
ncbi:hypothetical protein [Sphingomonas sp.]|uniref:hypothetical protein n=1 Tax=Sphingomonas sp. TaxID=28214 RepID=UPI0025E9AA01|nr:hypothetical protein [Sphingomonas sp.]